MNDKIQIAVIEPARDPYLKEIAGNVGEDGTVSYLSAMQHEVGGLIEFLDVLWGDNPALIVNEEYLVNGSQPNRAIYANEDLHAAGYLDMLTYSRIPEPGELYTIVFGTFIAVSYDDEGNPRDMPAEEWDKVCRAFCGVKSVLSGMVEVTRMRSNRCTEHIKVNLPDTPESYESGNGEGVWMLVDERTKAAHDNDEEGGVYFGLLDNDSFYFPGLNHGEVIPFEMRGDKRPVALFPWLVRRYNEILEAGR